MPVAVSVPASTQIEITMVEQNWSFGEIQGAPRVEAEEF